MSVTPPHNKSPDGDFVLWPEAPGQGAGRANEMMQRSLIELAPPESTAEAAAEAAEPRRPREPESREERFYPASRQWFRTTAAIAPTDPSDKWWQDVSPTVPAPTAPPLPSASAELLSPEEIWELAAEELEQVGRLGAPVLPPIESAESVPPAESPILPLIAIPVVAQPPLSLRPDPAPSTPLPTQRRTVLPAHKSEMPFAELGRPAERDDPTEVAAPAVPAEPVVAAEDRRRRRRHRVERHLPATPHESSSNWGRWIAVTISILLVATAAAAIVGRDSLPSGWKTTAIRWWDALNQMVLPHQQVPPRRGVVPRPGQPEPGTTAVVAAQSSAERAPQSSVTPPALDRPAEIPQTAVPPAPQEAIKSLPALPVEEDDAQVPSAVVPTPDPASDPVSTTEPAANNKSFTLWDGDNASSAEPSTATEATARATPAAARPAPGEVAEGQKAVRSLISARSADEVLPWIFEAPTLESAVRDYYGQYPLQPLSEAVVEHEYSGIIPVTGGKAHIFNVLDSAHPRGFPVSAESTPEGYRIDWQSYIQWRDGWLRRFLQSNSVEPQTLFVVLRRTHYFNDDVPKLDEKLAFKLTSAVPGDEGAVAFIEKDSAVGRSLAELYEWRTMYFPVVELQWVSVGSNTRYLRLNRIVRPTWRRIGQ